MSLKQSRLHKIDDSKRWELYRQKRNQMDNIKKKIFLELLRNSGFKAVIKVQQVITKAMVNYDRRLQEIAIRSKKKIYAKRLKRIFNRYLQKKGHNYTMRQGIALNQ